MGARKLRLRVVLVTIGLCVAVAIGMTAIGEAASPNVCATSSTGTPPSPASCLVETLAPHTLALGADGVSLTTLTNQSGGATATHTAVDVTFSPAVDIVPPISLVTAAGTDTTTCTSSTANNTTTVTCPDFGNVSAGGKAKVIVRYSSSTPATVSVQGQVNYGEKKDNQGGPNGTVNDTQVSNVDSVSISPAGTAVQSSCDAGNTIGSGDGQVTTSLVYTSAKNALLPCTPASAGVIQQVPAGLHSEIAFADFPELKGSNSNCAQDNKVTFCYATFTINFASLWTQLKNVVLFEDTAGAPNYFSTKITIPSCQSSGLPPKPGTVPAGQQDPSPKNDLCIQSRSNLAHSGGSFVLHALGSTVDPRAGG